MLYAFVAFTISVPFSINTYIVSYERNLPAFVSYFPSACNNMAAGMPTFLDLPQTTAFLPKVGIPGK